MIERQSASPAAAEALARMNHDIDARQAIVASPSKTGGTSRSTSLQRNTLNYPATNTHRGRATPTCSSTRWKNFSRVCGANLNRIECLPRCCSQT